ncbi:hypothetical protein MKW94_013693 [Papaver nudicaule]|uniref:Lipoxygenase n=1 Tax=Papaver nudicaule TaxID=74823 RepID=A0AA41RY00_PAPNU|nr:hypothetical protein [Papaver nudicaule]
MFGLILNMFKSFFGEIFKLFLLILNLLKGKLYATENIDGGSGSIDVEKKKMISGTVVLMKKNVLDFTDFRSSLLDRVDEFLGEGVSLQLVSAVNGDPENEMRGKLGKEAYIEHWISTITSAAAGSSAFGVKFEWDESIGVPGAFIVRNHHHSEFYLKSLTLEDVPGTGRVHFVCNSWVYPVNRYKYDRIFFANPSYLPNDTPEPLRKYREDELKVLRGDGTGELKEWDRVYDYAVYNDLGNPDKGPRYARPICGNSSDFPYPRRGRTGRKPTKTDPNYESRLFLLNIDIYVPRDERFGHLKMSDFLAYSLKSISQVLLPGIMSFFDSTPTEFDTLQQVHDLHEGGFSVPSGVIDSIRHSIPLQMIKEIFRTDGEHVLKFPVPHVVKEDKFAWRSDEEFGREMLAGVNPLDPELYGDHTSSITKEHIEHNLNGLTIDEALQNKKLFILDHHDTLIPYLNRINTTSTKTYATRTLLLYQKDGTLKPLAIELSLVHPYGEKHGAINEVFTPAESGVESSIWQLAKAYAAVNDSGVHQLISHWLNTHAVIEPFVIATNRQLSGIHPIYKLLQPHYRDTMNINALARQTLISAEGILESTVFPGKFAMELSATIYKMWDFSEQALPADLLKRGMAVPDQTKPHGLRLVIEDYPFAVDGLEIWSAIEKWVHEYCSFYYPTDDLIRGDTELQSWWEEVRIEGHGDLKDKPWWPKMQTLSDLTKSCTTIIWVASALHAAVNFGQFPYAGYLPNRPTVSRRFMPKPDTPEYAELERNPDLVFLKTITSQLQTLLGVSLIETLSRHSSDEVYLGQRDCSEWTSDKAPLEAFKRFGDRLVEIENKIMQMNHEKKFRNRFGPVNMPYTLLYPNTSDFTKVGGLTGKGIPNSVSI